MNALTSYPASLPRHIAIIMDGNGRWAQARHKPRAYGHQAGVKTVRRIVEYAGEIGIKHLTLFSFSTENWQRPKVEIAALLRLLKEYVNSDLERLHARDVKVRIIGSRDGLSDDILSIIDKVETRTQCNDSFYLNIAFNYGGRDEIVRAVQGALEAGASLADLDESTLSAHMDMASQPDPDIVIRTSGEKRISNFLLWQSAYAEYVFTDVLWPDFSARDLDAAILEFQSRDRRFGLVAKVEVA